MRSLSLREINRLPSGVHAVGNGLYLRVSSSQRSWLFRYSRYGKRSSLSIGSTNYIKLQTAKDIAFQLKQKLATGVDPVNAYKDMMGFSDEAESEEEGPLFKDVWSLAIDDIAKVKAWRNPKSEHQWRQTIEHYAVPTLGEMPVKKIGRDEVLLVLRPIWWTKTETAKKIVGRLTAIFDWCKAKGFREGDNPALWRGNLALSLPSPSRVYQSKPQRAIHWRELPDLIAVMWEKNTVSSLAVVFGCLTASRAKEFVLARWDEFDREDNLWKMPSCRRKDGLPFPHKVPMNKYTWACLDRLAHLERTPSQESFLFPGKSAKTICLDAPAHMITLCRFDSTMHGLRSTFLDWVADCKGSSYLHAAEKALSHSVGDKVTRAYMRTDKLEERVELMEEFAEYCFSKVKTVIN